MASKIPKKYCISVKRLQRNLLIWYSDMPETANGHITLLELNLSHIMVRTESAHYKTKQNIFKRTKKFGNMERTITPIQTIIKNTNVILVIMELPLASLLIFH